MAYTSVIPVRRLDRTVDYVQNKEKTTPKSLEEAVDYAANRDKTESACFETGLGCTTTSAFEDMRLNTLRWHKETGVQGYHLVQSFAEGEVTPELAHQIGVEFAEQLLLGKYQAIVTTHLNTKHYHNHIVWSAVSLEDGKKYHSNSKSYYTEVRALSDALCQKYGLSIIETPESLRGKRQYEKWRAEENNQPTWRTAIRQDVDEAIQQSLTWRQFLSAMERKGYEVRMGRKYPVLRPPGKERFVRFKTLGKRYTPEAIQTRILYPRSYRPYVENPPTIQHGRLRSGKPRRKLTGLRALYFRYCYELHIIVKRPASVKRVSFLLREDIAKLDRLDAETRFLGKHRIDTAAELTAHREAVMAKAEALTAQRQELRKDLRRLTKHSDPAVIDGVKQNISSLSGQIRAARKEVVLCDGIVQRSGQVRENLGRLVSQKEIERKEQSRNELFRRRGGASREDVAGNR